MDVTRHHINEVIVLGAGLAGLAAGHTLSRSGIDILVIEGDSTVGGLAKTLDYRGFRFDIGGHRFKTSNKKIERLVRQLVGEDLCVVRRSSKILLRGKYFDYPLKPLNAVSGLGIPTAARIIFDYAVEQIRRRVGSARPVSLEDWVVQNFGRTLFNIYFREYSEKVWGIDCSRICMEWMEQRIQRLSLGTAISKALFRSGSGNLRTLASEFLYPSHGIGQIGENLKVQIERRNRVLTSSRVVRINHSGFRIDHVTTRTGNRTTTHRGNEFVSSLPLAILVQLLYPRPPADVLDAASRLKYRDLVIVTIMLDRERVTDQTWIYIPERKIPFGRIHEPTNWSTKMAPPGKTLLVTEHFCFRGDDTWSASDHELTERTIASLVRLGFINRREVTGNIVLRVPRAYPLFELGYTEHHERICSYLEGYRNLRLIGRGGMFRYHNMDHALESGVAAAEGIMAGMSDEACEAYSPTGTSA